MTTRITPSKPVGTPRGRSAFLIAAIAIAAAVFVAIAVVRWQGSSDGTAAPAPITLPRVTAASASNGEGVSPRGGMPEAISAQQTDSTSSNVPAPVPDCMTVAHPIIC